MRWLGRKLASFLWWTYPRGSLEYDIMVAVILAFIFLTPARLFHDQPRPASPPPAVHSPLLHHPRVAPPPAGAALHPLLDWRGAAPLRSPGAGRPAEFRGLLGSTLPAVQPARPPLLDGPGTPFADAERAAHAHLKPPAAWGPRIRPAEDPRHPLPTHRALREHQASRAAA